MRKKRYLTNGTCYFQEQITGGLCVSPRGRYDSSTIAQFVNMHEHGAAIIRMGYIRKKASLLTS